MVVFAMNAGVFTVVDNIDWKPVWLKGNIPGWATSIAGMVIPARQDTVRLRALPWTPTPLTLQQLD